MSINSRNNFETPRYHNNNNAITCQWNVEVISKCHDIIINDFISPERSGGLYISIHETICNVRLSARLIVETMQISSLRVTNIADCIIHLSSGLHNGLPFP